MNQNSNAFGPWTYFTYPHCNGFCKDASKLVIGKLHEDRNQLWLYSIDGTPREMLAEHPASQKCMWWDIARETDELVTSVNNQLLVYDLDKRECSWIWTPPEGASLGGLSSISADGRCITARVENDDRNELWLIEREGRARPVLSVDRNWKIGHEHFCPADEDWIAFCHAWGTHVADRMWVWHPEHAPDGRCVFDQKSDRENVLLAVGHERWCFHDVCSVVVAYGEGEGEPRGLYMVYADDRPPRLISQADRDWHCNISRDGTLAVVDTTGAADAPGRGWENADGLSDVVLVNVADGSRQHLYRTGLMGSQQNWLQHPWHPHPHFTPETDRVIFHDCIDAGVEVCPSVIAVEYENNSGFKSSC